MDGELLDRSHCFSIDASWLYLIEQMYESFYEPSGTSSEFDVATEERIDMRWESSIPEFERSMSADRASLNCIEFSFALYFETCAAYRDSKFRKFSLVPRFVEIKSVKSLETSETTVIGSR